MRSHISILSPLLAALLGAWFGLALDYFAVQQSAPPDWLMLSIILSPGLLVFWLASALQAIIAGEVADPAAALRVGRAFAVLVCTLVGVITSAVPGMAEEAPLLIALFYVTLLTVQNWRAHRALAKSKSP